MIQLCLNVLPRMNAKGEKVYVYPFAGYDARALRFPHRVAQPKGARPCPFHVAQPLCPFDAPQASCDGVLIELDEALADLDGALEARFPTGDVPSRASLDSDVVASENISRISSDICIFDSGAPRALSPNAADSAGPLVD